MFTYMKYLYLKAKFINKGSRLNSKFVSSKAKIGIRTIIEKNTFIDQFSIIGDYTYLNPECSVEFASIGNFCSIAKGVHIGPTEHAYDYLSQHPFWYQPFYKITNANNTRFSSDHVIDTKIGNDVWLGLNVIVKKGVVIGDGAIVGAGSVVTKNIPPYEIWAGVPAKKIKERFNSDIVEKLLVINWPMFNELMLRQYVLPNIDNPQKFISCYEKDFISDH